MTSYFNRSLDDFSMYISGTVVSTPLKARPSPSTTSTITCGDFVLGNGFLSDENSWKTLTSNSVNNSILTHNDNESVFRSSSHDKPDDVDNLVNSYPREVNISYDTQSNRTSMSPSTKSAPGKAVGEYDFFLPFNIMPTINEEQRCICCHFDGDGFDQDGDATMLRDNGDDDVKTNEGFIFVRDGNDNPSTTTTNFPMITFRSKNDSGFGDGSFSSTSSSLSNDVEDDDVIINNNDVISYRTHNTVPVDKTMTKDDENTRTSTPIKLHSSKNFPIEKKKGYFFDSNNHTSKKELFDDNNDEERKEKTNSLLKNVFKLRMLSLERERITDNITEQVILGGNQIRDDDLIKLDYLRKRNSIKRHVFLDGNDQLKPESFIDNSIETTKRNPLNEGTKDKIIPEKTYELSMGGKRVFKLASFGTKESSLTLFDVDTEDDININNVNNNDKVNNNNGNSTFRPSAKCPSLITDLETSVVEMETSRFTNDNIDNEKKKFRNNNFSKITHKTNDDNNNNDTTTGFNDNCSNVEKNLKRFYPHHHVSVAIQCVRNKTERFE